MTAREADEGEPCAAEGAVGAECLDAVVRAGGDEAAVAAEKRAEGDLIELDECDAGKDEQAGEQRERGRGAGRLRRGGGCSLRAGW